MSIARKRWPNKTIEIVAIMLQEEHESNHKVILPQYDALFRINFGIGIKVLTNKKYAGESGFGSVDEVIKRTRYMSGPSGARCTKELKKQVRFDYQKPGDVHVFGFHNGEQNREDRLTDQENEIEVFCPLIELDMSKEYCIEYLKDYGFQIPIMYQLGYQNNNCVGCLKATGAGYWNKIRVDFPDVFETRSRQEELLGTALISVSANKFAQDHPEIMTKMLQDSADPNTRYKISIKSNGQLRLPLRYLPEDMGSHKDLDIGDCGIFCETGGRQS